MSNLIIEHDKIKDFIDLNLKQLYHHLIYFSGDRYENLKGRYGYVTGSLREDEEIILAVYMNTGELVTIRELILENGYDLLHNQIELCDDADFLKEVLKFEKLNQEIVKKLETFYIKRALEQNEDTTPIYAGCPNTMGGCFYTGACKRVVGMRHKTHQEKFLESQPPTTRF